MSSSAEIPSTHANLKPSGGGVNLGRRLATAGILIPIVGLAASFPLGWFFLNLGNISHLVL